MPQRHRIRRRNPPANRYVEAMLLEQMADQCVGKEPLVGKVENAALAVVELTDQQHQSNYNKPNIRRRHDHWVRIQYFMLSRNRSKNASGDIKCSMTSSSKT